MYQKGNQHLTATNKNPAFSWFPGKFMADGENQLESLFFYHLPKTGGTTAITSIRFAYDFLFKHAVKDNPSFSPPASARFDEPADLDRQFYPGTFSVVATHHPFGFHRRFSQSFKLITLLRDPFNRILSAYTYRCMRNGAKPSLEEFKKFFTIESNCNLMVKQLSGLHSHEIAFPHHVETAKNNLIEAFSIYGTTSNLQNIVSSALQLSCLPNVFCDRFNDTKDEYRLHDIPFEAEIRSLNSMDQILYEFVDHNPKLGEHWTPSPCLNQLTIIIRQTRNDTGGSKGTAWPVHTETILPHIEKIIEGSPLPSSISGLPSFLY